VDAAEVVVVEVRAVRGPQVLLLFAEGIRQPREAAHLHANREVLAFYMAGANLRWIGVSHDLLRLREVGRTVPELALSFFRVRLDDVGKIAVSTGGRGDYGYVRLKSIGTYLEALRSSRAA
jgi:hypothetical protein